MAVSTRSDAARLSGRIEILEDAAQAVFQEWFVWFRFAHQDRPCTKDDLPNGWEWCPIGEAATWLSGGTPSTSNSEFWGGEIPWITSGSLRSFLLTDSERRLTEAGLAAGSRLLPRDAVVFVVRGMSLVREFRLGIADRPVAFGQDCKGLIAAEGIEPLFLAFAVRELSPRIHGMVELAGHGTGKLSTDRLKALRIPRPPIEVQRSFVTVVKPMREEMSLLGSQVRIAKRLRDLLLPQLMSGAVDASRLELDDLIELVA